MKSGVRWVQSDILDSELKLTGIQIRRCSNRYVSISSFAVPGSSPLSFVVELLQFFWLFYQPPFPAGLVPPTKIKRDDLSKPATFLGETSANIATPSHDDSEAMVCSASMAFLFGHHTSSISILWWPATGIPRMRWGKLSIIQYQTSLTRCQVCQHENCASGHAATAIRRFKSQAIWYR